MIQKKRDNSHLYCVTILWFCGMIIDHKAKKLKFT